MPQIAKGQFTGMITTFRNQSLLVGLQPCVTMLQELASNDEFQNRAGVDDSTKRHFIQLIQACDKNRRMITYNPDQADIKAIIDIGRKLEDNMVKPLTADTIQLSSTPMIEVPWQFDGSDPNIPLFDALRFRNGVGGLLYGAACNMVVAYTRIESRNRASMITVNDSLRVYSLMQSFKDLCDRLLGEANQVDVSQPLQTDEPAGLISPNRIAEVATILRTPATTVRPQ